MIAALAAALADMVKSAEDEMQTKDGHVNPSNVDKLKQAYTILHDVFRTGGIDEKPHLVRAKGVSVYELKSALDPVLEYHGIGAEATEQGVNLFGIDCASEEAIDALGLVLRTLES